MSRNETISLLELFTDIDESYITEATPMKNMVQPFFAEPVKKSRKPIFAIAGIAACFAVVFAIGTPVAGLQQLNTKFNFNSVFVGNPHDLNHSRGYLALFFKR